MPLVVELVLEVGERGLASSHVAGHVAWIAETWSAIGLASSAPIPTTTRSAG